jgi:signal transduction histidine kinase
MTDELPAHARRWLRYVERFALLLLVLLTLISSIRLGSDVGRPFPGFLIDYDWREQQFEYSVTTPAWWYVARQRLLPPDIEIQALHGASLLTLPAISQLLWQRQVSAEIAHDPYRGRTLTRSPIILFDWQHFLDLRIPTLIITLVKLFIALLLHTARTDSAMRRALFWGVMCSAVVFGIDRPSLFWMEDMLAHVLITISQMFAALTSLAMVGMACLFIPAGRVRVRGALIVLAGTWSALAVLLWLNAALLHGAYGIARITTSATRMAEITLGLLFLFSAAVLMSALCLFIALWWGRRDASPAVRAQVRAGIALLAGLILGMPPVLLTLISRLFGEEIPPFIGTFDLRFLLLFIPLFATSAIVHHKTFRQDSPVFTGVLLLIGVALVSSLLNSMYMAAMFDDRNSLYTPSLFLPTFFILLVTFSVILFYPRIVRRAARFFARDRFSLQSLSQFADRLRRSDSLTYDALIDELCIDFRIDYAALWLATPVEGRFHQRVEREHPQAPSLRSIWLHQRDERLMCSEDYISVNPPDLALPDALRSLCSSALVEGILPLTRRDRLIGFLVISLPHDADAFFAEDLLALRQVAQQIAQHLDHIQQREEINRIRMWLHNETLTRFWRWATDLHQLRQQQDARFHPVIDTLLNDIDLIRGTIRHIHQGTFTQSLIDIPKRCAEYQERFGIDIDSTHLDRRLRLSPWQEHDIVQWVTEALNNIVRHAGAKRAVVCLAYHERTNRIRLMVHDDGRWNAARNPHGGTGLGRIADSVAGWGGTFTLETPPYGGTCLTIDLPYPENLPVPTVAEPPRPAPAR